MIQKQKGMVISMLWRPDKNIRPGAAPPEKEGKTMISTDKKSVLENYKEARKAYLLNRTQENWILFCNAKTLCMRMGIRI